MNDVDADRKIEPPAKGDGIEPDDNGLNGLYVEECIGYRPGGVFVVKDAFGKERLIRKGKAGLAWECV